MISPGNTIKIPLYKLTLQELDLRIGAAFTRFQTLRLQKKFPDVLAEQLISYGSCQFPTLGFVVGEFEKITLILLSFVSLPVLCLHLCGEAKY